jgi:DNA-binding transcriptional ArsR family regulator
VTDETTDPTNRSDAADPGDGADTFAALSDETRVGILRALWEASGHRASFSELREAVGARDSGRFNYHLDKLVGDFVARTDDGYRLRRAGVHVVGTLIAGTYDQEAVIDDTPYPEPCPECGGDTRFTYDGETAAVECVDDGLTLVQAPAPPSVFVDADPDAIDEAVEAYVESMVSDFRAGFCLYCRSPVESTLRPMADLADDASEVSEDIRHMPATYHQCPTCGESVHGNPGIELASHPAVVSFFHDHGVDVRERSVLDLLAVTDEDGVVEGTDPTRARIRYTVGDAEHADDDGAELVLLVDESLDVLDVTRSDR